MNVGELKEYIDGIPDDVEIFLPGPDHSIIPAQISYWYVTKSRGQYFEFIEDQYLEDGEEKIRALVVE